MSAPREGESMSGPAAAPRTSPLAAAHETRGARWGEAEDMALPLAAARCVTAAAPVTLRDVSYRRRLGCKGAQAPRWLAEHGVPVPAAFNHFVEHDGLLVARLAATEFLLEAQSGLPPILARTAAALQARVDAQGSGVYPVLREDAAIELGGAYANDLLVQTCNVNFRPLATAAAAAAGALVMTQMIGVSVLVVPQRRGEGVVYRLWCDPTFGPYLWSTLLEIAEDLDGGMLPSIDV
jgi:sarcosine oxidase subunit gamma